MTHLHTYLTSSGVRQIDLARRIGLSRGYVSELCGGTKKPSLAVALAIERETGGKVPASSWINAENNAPVVDENQHIEKDNKRDEQ